MLVIRLRRTGKKNQPAFKMVVTEKKTSPTKGTSVEEVGFWNPLTKERILKEERIKYWISVGAQTSNTVHNMLVESKIIDGEKTKKHNKPKKKEEDKKVEVKKETETKEEVKEEKPEKEEKEVETKEEVKEAKEEKQKEDKNLEKEKEESSDKKDEQ